MEYKGLDLVKSVGTNHLVLFGPLRKSTSNSLITFLIWSAYLLADWAPRFGVGLIADNKRYAAGAVGGDGEGSGSGTSQLGALWAQFLLLHLGGSDSINAYSLEDNELWLRLLFGVIAQAVAAGYIFFQMLPGGNSYFLIPSIFVFIAGTIKCFERILAAHLASEKNVQESIMKQFSESEEHESTIDKDKADLVSKIFIGMIVGLFPVFNLDPFIEGASKDFLFSTSADALHALQAIEVELSFIYEFFHTKLQLLLSGLGNILRFISLCSIVIALSVFYSHANSFNDAFDVAFTYTLFWATIALELISVGRILHSRAEKRKLVSLKSTPLLWRKWSRSVSKLSWITYLVKARPLQNLRQNQSNASASTRIFAKSIVFLGIHRIVDDIRIRTSITDEPLSQELWEFIFNQINEKAQYVNHFLPNEDYSLSEDQINQFYAINRVNQSLHYLADRLPNYLVNKFQLHDRINNYVGFNDPVLERLMAKTAAKREIYSSRGHWVLRKWESTDAPDNAAVKKIMEAMKAFPGDPRRSFFQDVLIWHAATELLHSTDEHQVRYRVFSKLISDYMLYLLAVKPEMLNQVADTIRSALQESWVMVKHVSGNKPSLEPNEVMNACRRILNPDSRIEDSVMFFQGRELATELQKLGRDKWSLMAQVWVEMLAYAATHCRPRTHAQQLCNGGELITIVWSLIIHFGLVDTRLEDQIHLRIDLQEITSDPFNAPDVFCLYVCVCVYFLII